MALALAAKLVWGRHSPHGRRFVALGPWPLAPLAEAPSLTLSIAVAVAVAFLLLLFLLLLLLLSSLCRGRCLRAALRLALSLAKDDDGVRR